MSTRTSTEGGAGLEPGGEREREVSGPNEAWSRALETRVTRLGAAGMAPVRGAAASRREPQLGRRRFLRGAFWTGVLASVGAGVGMLLDFLYPRNIRGFGGPVAAGHVEDYPVGGDPVSNFAGRFYLVHLDEADKSERGGEGAGGLLALWRKCPHLGCTVPWNAGFSFDDERGWFRCPCHQSTYTKAGVRVFGPAPRSMDPMRLEIADDGAITVHTDLIASGGPDNPSRAVAADRPTAYPTEGGLTS